MYTEYKGKQKSSLPLSHYLLRCKSELYRRVIFTSSDSPPLSYHQRKTTCRAIDFYDFSRAIYLHFKNRTPYIYVYTHTHTHNCDIESESRWREKRWPALYDFVNHACTCVCICIHTYYMLYVTSNPRLCVYVCASRPTLAKFIISTCARLYDWKIRTIHSWRRRRACL